MNYLEFNKEKIKENVLSFCVQNRIKYIFAINDMTFKLIDYIFDGKEEINEIQIYSINSIFNNTNYAFLSDENILLFLDTLENKKEYYDVINVLNDLITLSVKTFGTIKNPKKKITPNYFHYCLAACTTLDTMDNFKSYESEKMRLSKFYKFQKEIHDTLDNINYNSGYPLLFVNIESIFEFKKILRQTFNNYFECLENFGNFNNNCYWVNGANNKDTIVLDNNCELSLFFGNFLIGTAVELAYRQNQDDTWDCFIIPKAITGNIKHKTLEKWYKTVFKNYFCNFNNSVQTRPLYFRKMYNYITYLINYYIGVYFSNILINKGMNIEYKKENTIKHYGYNFEFYVSSLIETDGASVFYRMTNQNNEHNQIHLNYITVRSVNELFSDDDFISKDFEGKVIKSIFCHQSDETQNKLLTAENFIYLCKTKTDFIKAIAELLNFERNDIITCNVKLTKNNEYVINDIIQGPSYKLYLPYRVDLFFAAIYELYNGVKRDYEKYKENYEIFSNKIEIYFEHLDCFKYKKLTVQQFEFLRKYFNDLNESDFEKSIESKKWLLNSNDWNLNCIQAGSELIFAGLQD